MHANKLKVGGNYWIPQLIPLLPMDIVQIVLREPNENQENYEYIKKALLRCFKLSSEALLLKLYKLQRRPGSL